MERADLDVSLRWIERPEAGGNVRMSASCEPPLMAVCEVISCDACRTCGAELVRPCWAFSVVAGLDEQHP